MLATSQFESSEHFENPPNLLIWFYIFEIKNKIKTFTRAFIITFNGARESKGWLLAAWKGIGVKAHATQPGGYKQG